MRRCLIYARPLHTMLKAMLALVFLLMLAACSASHTQRPQPNAATGAAATQTAQAALAARQPDPVVSPSYIYDQLATMTTRFQHRQAGYDSNPAGGHDAFATYWTQEITADLQGFGPQTLRDPFHTDGWLNKPASVPGVNVEVSVPGALHPEQVVIVGCHYDGEAISTESAYDDASGCAIELGVAQAMASYWRAHHLYPARTLRFVIFDAEEQGLVGSFHYVNTTVNGDLAHIVAMFNEEQNGVNYPLRYLGDASNPQMPYVIDLSQAQESAHTRAFEALVQQAVSATFAQFRALGMQTLTYRTISGAGEIQQVFTPDQLNLIQVKDGALGGSDEYPFIAQGVTQATFGSEGDTYPFDTAHDTLALMNTFASGSAGKSEALVYALALPAGLTSWMLKQPGVLGAAPAPHGPLEAISDVGQTVSGQPLTLDARASFDPSRPGAALTYHWDFGDGATASGVAVSHTYAATGAYTITLVVQSETGVTTVHKAIQVVDAPSLAENPFPRSWFTGAPQLGPDKLVPTPDPRLAQALSSTSASAPQSSASGSPALALLLTLAALIVLAGAITLLARQRMLAWSARERSYFTDEEIAQRQRRREALRQLVSEHIADHAGDQLD